MYENQTVLIVDDQPGNITLTADFLESRGIEVMMSKSGIDALETAVEGAPDLILLDVRLPGMDGFEVCERLKRDERTRQIPVIFMTALSELEDKLKGFFVGGLDYVTKPVQESELLARVGVHLQLRSLQRQLEERNTSLEGALDTGSVVNVAIGVLMERESLSRQAAFESIRQQARSERRKVADIAGGILADKESDVNAK